MEEEMPEEEEVTVVNPDQFYAGGGSFFLGSDVSGTSFTGWEGVLGYQTHLSNPVFLRLGLIYANDKDIDDVITNSKENGVNQTLQDLGYAGFVRNYSTTQIGLQAKIGWEFVNVINEEGRKTFSIYAIGGPDIFYYSAKYDALNENDQIYDFSTINFDGDDPQDQVEELLDGEYETDGHEAQRLGISLNLGLGFELMLSETVGLGLEHQTGLTFNDKLDGYESEDTGDSVNHTRLLLYFTL